MMCFGSSGSTERTVLRNSTAGPLSKRVIDCLAHGCNWPVVLFLYGNTEGCTSVCNKSSSSALTADTRRAVHKHEDKGRGSSGPAGTTPAVRSPSAGSPVPLRVCESGLDAKRRRHVTEQKQGSWTQNCPQTMRTTYARRIRTGKGPGGQCTDAAIGKSAV